MTATISVRTTQHRPLRTPLVKRRRRRPSTLHTTIPSRHRYLLVAGSSVVSVGDVRPMSALLDLMATLHRRFPATPATLVVDASFPHSLNPAERARFDAALLSGSLVTPPAGCVGHTAGFLRAVVARSAATVVTAFHDSSWAHGLTATRFDGRWDIA